MTDDDWKILAEHGVTPHSLHALTKQFGLTAEMIPTGRSVQP